MSCGSVLLQSSRVCFVRVGACWVVWDVGVGVRITVGREVGVGVGVCVCVSVWWSSLLMWPLLWMVSV